MKKIFTFIAIILLSPLSLMAQTTVFEWGDITQSSLPSPTVGTLENVNLDGYAEIKISTNTTKVKGLKCGSSMMNSGAVTKYYKIKPATGGFEAGDTIIYTHVYNNSSEKTTTISVATISDNTIRYTGHPTLNARNVDGWTADTCVLAVDADSLALGREGNTGTFILSIKVIRPADDGVAALTVTPANITLNATASEPNPSANVTFKGKNLAAGTYNLTLPNVAGLTANPASVTVGEDGKLNATVTISYSSDAEVAASSATVGLTIGELTQNVTVNYSAVIAKSYASSVNIEGWVVANGVQNADKNNVSSVFTAVLDAAHIEYANLNALDSLNNSKGNGRNEAYLGLKMKTAGAYMACWIQAGQTIRVKFGNVGDDVQVSINGAEQTIAKAQLANPLEYTATADAYVKFQTKSGSTVVVKQIMIDEPIVSVMNKIAYQVGEGGTVSGWTVAFPGEEVVLDITSNEGYAVNNIAVNGIALVQSAPAAPISFTMPAEDATVTATFGDTATGVENAETGVQAQKVIRDGQVMILRDGKLFTTTGIEVR